MISLSLTILAVTGLVGASAACAVFADRSLRRRRERAAERKFLERWTLIYGIAPPSAGETNEQMRDRIVNRLRNWR